MAKKPDDMKAQLAELSEESALLDAKIDEMIADMAQIPPDRRAGSPWAPDGEATRRYLELTARQAEVESEMAELVRALAASNGKPPASSQH